MYTSRSSGHSAIDDLLIEKWNQMDKDGSGSLALDELRSLLINMNVVITERDLRAKFAKFDTSKDGELSIDEFRRLFAAVNDKPGPEIDEMFAEYAGSGSEDVLSPEALAKLLREKQGEDGSETPGATLSRIKGAVAAKWLKTAAGETPANAVEDEALKRFGRETRRLAEASSADSGAAASSAASGASASAEEGDAAAIVAAARRDDPEASADTAARVAAQRKAAAEAAKTGAADAGGLSLQEFASYLASPELNGPLKETAHDMGHPLSHYFISSTHNSYLSGNQLNGESTADAIRRALALGARVIELDCYSEAEAAVGTAEPWVTHGGTLTSKLPFRAAVRAIAEYAFRDENVVPTKAPVILTLENHCSMSGNEVQAAILKEELGAMLYVPPNPRPAAYPSPAALMGKVVLRDKPGKMLSYEGSAAKELALAAVTEEEEELEEEDEDEREQEEAKAAAIRAGTATDASVAPGGETGGPSPSKGVKGKKHKELHPNLMALVAIPNTKFKAFDAMDRYAPGPASSSFSEEKMEAIAKGSKAKGSPAKVTTLAQTHLVRVYPKGVRVDSSNFDPGRFWALGCQLTALNYQHGDRSVFANQAQFAQNGGLGYVLKPDWMLASPVAEYDALGGAGRKRPGEIKPVSLTVTVISGHFLPKPRGYHETGDIIDPFVEVHIVGAPADTALHVTGAIDDNGFNPRWLVPDTPSLKPTKTFTISRPDVAVLLFIVKDKNIAGSVTVAQAGVPVRALRPGVRALALNDGLSVPLVASKLMIRTHLA